MSTSKYQQRNPRGWKRYQPTTRGLIAAGAIVIVGAAVAIHYIQEPKAIDRAPIPRPTPDPRPPAVLPPLIQPIPAVQPVPPGARYGTAVTLAVPAGGESFDIVVRPLIDSEAIDVAIQTSLSTQLDSQTSCIGLGLGARASMSESVGEISVRTSDVLQALCPVDSVPWPSDPLATIEFDGNDLVLRVEAPDLGQDYSMTVTLTVTETHA